MRCQQERRIAALRAAFLGLHAFSLCKPAFHCRRAVKGCYSRIAASMSATIARKAGREERSRFICFSLGALFFCCRKSERFVEALCLSDLIGDIALA